MSDQHAEAIRSLLGLASTTDVCMAAPVLSSPVSGELRTRSLEIEAILKFVLNRQRLLTEEIGRLDDRLALAEGKHHTTQLSVPADIPHDGSDARVAELSQAIAEQAHRASAGVASETASRRTMLSAG